MGAYRLRAGVDAAVGPLVEASPKPTDGTSGETAAGGNAAFWPRPTSLSGSAACWPSTRCPCRSTPARSSASSGRTAPARRRSSTSSAGSSTRARARITYRGTPLRRHHPHDLAKLGIARTLQGVGLCAGLTVHENVMLGAEPVLHSDLGVRLPRPVALEPGGAPRGRAGHGRSSTSSASRTTPAGCPRRLPYAHAEADRAGPRAHGRAAAAPARRAGERALRDRDGRARVALIRGLTDAMSVLLVEHHMDLVMSVCDRLVVLNFGQVIAEGTPAADPLQPRRGHGLPRRRGRTSGTAGVRHATDA